ncbi:MAG TPA: NAD(P)-dependent oxidoreductase [Burkholderiales bacterium]|nr:NAD(P)-dependent oxidoreductase [Burkholderiales bacterium]
MILVTGGAGFVGLNVVEQLRARGDEVRVYDVERPALDVPFERGDVTQSLDQVLDGVTRIIHLAAITADAARDARDPRRIAEVNFLGTLNVLEAARRHGIQRVFHASTGALYGAAGVAAPEPLDEERDRPVPESMYGITKYAAERACLRLASLWKLDVRIGRLAMAFGRWEHATGARTTLSPPTLVARIARQGGEAVFPPRGPTDYIYAPDLASALIALLDAKEPRHRLYHLSTGAAWSLPDWCELLAKRFPKFRWRESTRAEEWNVVPLSPATRTRFSNRRLVEDLGWQPRFTVAQALDDFLAWMDKHDEH